MNAPTRLVCKGCGRQLPVEAFYRRKNTTSGYAGKCKECQKGAARNWYAANKDHRSASQKAWYADNRERRLENLRAYRERAKREREGQ